MSVDYVTAMLSVEGEYKSAKCGFASIADAEAISIWEAKDPLPSNSAASEAAEFARLAHKRWRYYRQQGACVESTTELRKWIACSPEAEISMLAVLKADWFPASPILGICHFRRTWINNLFIDFLASHPEIAAGKHPRVKGVGTWLLSFVIGIASEIDAAAVWGETTKASAPFYEKIFSLRRVTDQFRVPRSKFAEFRYRVSKPSLDKLIEEYQRTAKLPPA